MPRRLRSRVASVPASPTSVAQHLDRASGRAGADHVAHPDEVRGELLAPAPRREACRAARRAARCRRPTAARRPIPSAAGCRLRDGRRTASARSPASSASAEPHARRSHASALRTDARSRNSGPATFCTGTPASVERHLDRHEHGVDPREHRDLGGSCAVRRGAWRTTSTVAPPDPRPRRTMRTPLRAGRGERMVFGDAPQVAAQHPVDLVDHVRRGSGSSPRAGATPAPGTATRTRSASAGRRRCSRRSSGRRRRRRTPAAAGPASSRSSSTCAGVRSWNSSASTTRQARCAAARAAGSVSSSRIAPVICPSKSTAPEAAQRVLVTAGSTTAKPVDVAVVDRARPRPPSATRVAPSTSPRATARAGRPIGGEAPARSRPSTRRTSRSVERGAALRLRRERRRAVEHGERDRVERAHLHAGDVGEPPLHLHLRAPVVRDERERRRREPPAVHEVAGALGEHAGLARPCRRDDPGRAAGVGDRGELVGGEVGARWRWCRTGAANRARPRWRARRGRRRSDRSTAAVRRRSTPRCRRAAATSPSSSAPSGRAPRSSARDGGRVGGATVPDEHGCVAPHQVVQQLRRELAQRTDLVERHGSRRRAARRRTGPPGARAVARGRGARRAAARWCGSDRRGCRHRS